MNRARQRQLFQQARKRVSKRFHTVQDEMSTLCTNMHKRLRADLYVADIYIMQGFEFAFEPFGKMPCIAYRPKRCQRQRFTTGSAANLEVADVLPLKDVNRGVDVNVETRRIIDLACGGRRVGRIVFGYVLKKLGNDVIQRIADSGNYPN